MNTLTRTETRAETSNNEARGSILGATGLPRAVLAEMFRRRGLFGRDSQLDRAEQAVVQSRLPAIPGMARLPVTALATPRLKALADYVEALVIGRDTGEARSRVIAAGLSGAAALEAAVTVDNIRVVFGPTAAVITRSTRSTVTPEAALPAYSRAA